MSFLDSFRTSPPRRQIAIAALVSLAIFLILGGAYILFLNHPFDVLFSNVRTSDAATIVGELDKQKIPYRLEDGGTTIRVPRDLVDRTRLDIASQDLPIKGMVGFELFNKSDIGLTEFAQKINYQRALQGELARTIMTMDTIDTARVHLSMSEPTIFRDDRRPPKASVTLLPRSGRQISSDTVRGVQRLVAAAVPDLSVSDVVVLNEHGQVVSSDAASPASTSPLNSEKQAVEQYYAAKIRRALLKLVGDGVADVAVSANLDAVASAAGDSEGLLTQWTPSARSFPLGVTIFLDTPASAEVVQEVKSLAGEAIGLDANLNDTLTVSTTGQPSNAGRSTEPAKPPSVPAGQSKSAHPFPYLSAVLAALMAPLGVLLIVLSRRRHGAYPRKLTDQQRGDYARRLEILLEKGDAHATSGH